MINLIFLPSYETVHATMINGNKPVFVIMMKIGLFFLRFDAWHPFLVSKLESDLDEK